MKTIELRNYLTTGVLPGGGSVRMTFVGITVRLVPSIFVTIQFFGSQILVENVYRLFGILTLLSSFTNTASLYKQSLKNDCNICACVIFFNIVNLGDKIWNMLTDTCKSSAFNLYFTNLKVWQKTIFHHIHDCV